MCITVLLALFLCMILTIFAYNPISEISANCDLRPHLPYWNQYHINRPLLKRGYEWDTFPKEMPCYYYYRSSPTFPGKLRPSRRKYRYYLPGYKALSHGKCGYVGHVGPLPGIYS